MTAILRPTDLDRTELARLKVDTLTLADDGMDYAGRIVEKPWGRERELFRSESFSTWELRLNARAETSLHAHCGKDSVLMVSEGRVIVETLQGKHGLSPGDAIIIMRGVFHRTYALEAALVVEIENSRNRRDIVRLSDRYGRGQGYAGVYKAEKVG